jgi:hypothetical protein
MPRSDDIPPRYACIVPDHVLHEIATATQADPLGLIQKFGAWATRNASRLWFGRTIEDLIDLQWERDGSSLSMQDVVHPWRTRRLREFAKQSSCDWRSFLTTIQDSPSISYHLDKASKLTALCDQIADNWRATYPIRSLTTVENQIEWIRRPELVKPFVTGPYAARWRPEWTSTIAAAPNRFALVRWARFISWYCMRRIAGEQGKFENNFDDAVYGLLASYTGHLGTNDRGLRHAVEAIFPSVRILDQNRLIEIAD